jgi:hypothetical protein
VEVLAGVALDLEQRPPRPVDEQVRDAWVHLDEEGLDPGLVGRELAQLALDRDRDRLLGQDHALAIAGGARLREDLAHAVGDVLARHLDEPER